MAGLPLAGWISRTLRGRRRTRSLEAATRWPVAEAKLLKPVVVAKDELAEGTTAQDSQLEIPFYFSLPGDGYASGFFGGHVRSTPLSYSEAARLLPQVAEGARLRVRYNPANPDQSHALATDNEGRLPFPVWPS